MKVFLKTTLALLLAVCLFPGIIYADTTTPEGQPSGASSLSMEVQYGYDNTAKGGRYIPVQVQISNSAVEQIEGSLQILSMESDNEIYRYDYPVTLPAKGTSDTSVYVPIGSRASQLYVNVTDNAGNQLIHKRLKLGVNLDVSELFIGILSDTPEKLDYFDGVGINYSLLKTRSFHLNTEDFPTDKIGLDMLDVLVISNYRIRNLSEQQTRAIMDWVKNGGTLLMGTGNRVDDTLGRFAPELLDDIYDSPENMQINMGLEYTKDGPDDAVLTLPCVDFSLHGGNIILPNDTVPILTAVNKENGLIGVAAYDFVDISDFCREQPSYIDNLFTKLLGDDKISTLSEAVYSGNSSKFWSVQSLINTGDVDRLPAVALYITEILAYIFLVGPGLYLFLHQRELGHLYRKGVIVLSLAFTCIIYLMGSRTRFSGTFFTYASIQDASEDTISESTYINVRTPYNRPYTVSLDPDYSVLPLTRSFYSENTSPVKFTGEETSHITINYQADATTISAQQIGAFDPRFFQLEKREDNTEKVGFTGKIQLFDEKVTGTVTNNYDYPVEHAALLLYGRMILLDTIEPGETKQLDDLELLRVPLVSSYLIAEKISGGDKFSQTDITDKDYMLALERTNLLIFYLDNYMTGYTADARIVAFGPDKTDSQFLQTGSRCETYGLTMLTSTLELNNKDDGSLYRSVLMKKPSTITGSYSAATNTISGAEPVTLEYALGNDVTIEKLMFNQLSDTFGDSAEANQLAVFSGSISCYNFTTGNFDQLKPDQRELTAGQLDQYLSPTNTMTVKYVSDNTSEFKWDIILPMLTIVGGVR